MTILAIDLILFPAGLLVRVYVAPYLALIAIGFSGLTAAAVLSTRISGPSAEKRLFMRTYRVLSSLTNYLMDSSKIEERGVAKKRLRLLIERVERLWSLDSTLEEEALAPIPAFEKNLRDRALYAVEEGSVEDIRNSCKILSRFARFLLEDHPQVSEVEDINQSFAPLNERPANKGSWITQFFRWLRDPPRVRVVLPLCFALASGPAYFIASTVGGVPPQVAFGPATTVTMGFTTAFLTYYFARVRPEKKNGESETGKKEDSR
jgi:hypothetical protein